MNAAHIQGVPRTNSMPSRAHKSASQYQATCIPHRPPGRPGKPVRLDRFQEGVGLGRNILVNQDVSLRIENADVHRFGMQVDPAVILVRFGIKSHVMISFSQLTCRFKFRRLPRRSNGRRSS